MTLNREISAGDIDVPRLLAELRQWVEIETHTSDAGAVNRLADRVQVLAEGLGLKTQRIAGMLGFGDTLIVSSGHRIVPVEKGILILAHLDTVHAAGTISEQLPWREDGNRIYGPGIYDMKSGALLALEALKLALDCGNGPKLPVSIMYVPDEEMGSTSSRAVIEQHSANARYALVVEPARDGGKIVVARKGVGMYDIKVRGRASHTGTHPHIGRSAIREAAKIVLALEALNDPARGITVTVGTIHGGTGRNTVPAECNMLVDVRLPDAAAAKGVLGTIENMKSSDPDLSVEIRGGLNRPPFTQTPAAKSLFVHASNLAAPLGIALVGVSTGGGSDGNFSAAQGVPTLDGLGADGAGAHTFDEHILRDSIAPRTALLANLLLTLDGSQ
ncbi:glutamate carboxypeptidase [Phyllobacterium trifolii]|uniref:Glutamate carboxypeptidase n=1 Tax=Phyllobacterium trifolii TaxID=300193 RepID=A0A839UBY2_9HYPH|nr:M20 family metallopeptidase [Phyllobacterium trifolii]MBB3148556.1 glutamate carboxypeptidase [Phyllobacterium trifolii]